MSLLFHQISTYINATLAWISNTLLIYLIIRKSPNTLANYKYVMLMFAIFGLLFGLIDITCQPMLHLFQGCYVVFSRNVIGMRREWSFWYIALNTAFYAMALSLLALHFFYRYLAVCRPQKLYYFSFPHILIPMAIVVFVTADWWLTSVYFAGDSEEVDEYVRQTMLETFQLKTKDFTYVSTLYYRKDGSVRVAAFAYVANLLVIITTGFSIIFICWFKIHRNLINPTYSNRAIRTLDMQRQLFRALIAQTIIPVLILFFPAFILLTFPMFYWEIRNFEVFLLFFITLEPFLDALVPMYFIKSYRVAVKGWISKRALVSVSITVEQRGF